MYDLSILIPSRNEIFLRQTVEDICKNKRGKTEVIVVLDGCWAEPQLVDHPDVTIIHNTVARGQRAATNQAAKLSNAKFVAKCDAHCSFDEGFDVKLMNDMQDNWTIVPIMRNLHAFNWVCQKCKNETYQGQTPTACAKCDNKTDFKRDIKWIGKHNPQSTSYCFDTEPHFQYFKQYSRTEKYQKDLKETQLTETMSLQGSFFMMTREKYWELNICDEEFGSWGNQGIEVAVKTWLSGGRVLCNHKTWYAHMFRTQGGDFGFPYENPGKEVTISKKKVRDLFFNNKWDKAIHPLSWLIEKFMPIQGWSQQDINKLKGE
jgi:glycosyltransferase involved in cell wall biosynthesis